MGNLHKVWVDLPEDSNLNYVNSMKRLENNFEKHFGVAWLDTMVGAGGTFELYKDWDGYIALRDLKRCTGLLVSDLKADKIYRIILG